MRTDAGPAHGPYARGRHRAPKVQPSHPKPSSQGPPPPDHSQTAEATSKPRRSEHSPPGALSAEIAPTGEHPKQSAIDPAPGDIAVGRASPGGPTLMARDVNARGRPTPEVHGTWDAARATRDGPRRSNAVAVSVVLSDGKRPPFHDALSRSRFPDRERRRMQRRTLRPTRTWWVKPPKVHGPWRATVSFLLFVVAMAAVAMMIARLAYGR